MARKNPIGLVTGILLLLITGMPASAQEEAVEIVVTGRQPGPPLWLVTNGDRYLYILPTVSTVPKDMFWEDDELARIIANADEYIMAPGVGVDVSKLVMLNPINWVRAPMLMKKVSRTEDEETLEEVLPAEVYQRFLAIKEEYFPRNRKLEKMRPAFVSGQMMQIILDEEKLEGSEEIIKHVEKLVRRNREIIKTDATYEYQVEGGYGDIKDRILTMSESMQLEDEISCFEEQLTVIERHLDEMKYVANAWAGGYVNDIEDVAGDMNDKCEQLILESSEGRTIQELRSNSRRSWMEAVNKAIQTNSITFTILPFNALQNPDGFLQDFISMGYEVHVPD